MPLTRTPLRGILDDDSPPQRLSYGEAPTETANQGESFVRLAEQIHNRLDDQSCDYVSCQPPQKPSRGATSPAAVSSISAFTAMMGHLSHLLPQSRRCCPRRVLASAKRWRLMHRQEEPDHSGEITISRRQVGP